MIYNFEELCNKIEQLAEDNKIAVRIESHPEECMLRIFGPGATGLHRARWGFSDMEEMAHTSTEHHPHWRLLNNTLEVLRPILDGWDGEISKDDRDYIRWAANSLLAYLDEPK